MVLTRSQYENMSKEKFIQELTDMKSSIINDINTKLSNLEENLMISCQNMTMLIQSCSSVNNLTLIC